LRLLLFAGRQDYENKVKEGSSSQGRKVSPRIEGTTRVTVYSYVGLPRGVSVAPRENLRASG